MNNTVLQIHVDEELKKYNQIKVILVDEFKKIPS